MIWDDIESDGGIGNGSIIPKRKSICGYYVYLEVQSMGGLVWLPGKDLYRTFYSCSFFAVGFEGNGTFIVKDR